MDAPCKNGGDCIPLQLGRYKCKCLPGWEGANCEKNIGTFIIKLPCIYTPNEKRNESYSVLNTENFDKRSYAYLIEIYSLNTFMEIRIICRLRRSCWFL